MSPYPVFTRNSEAFLLALAGGNCVSIVGLSNMGKTTRLRQLLNGSGPAQYAALSGRNGLFVFVDCNRMVELTAQGFYEVILRSAVEVLSKNGEFAARFREYHNRVASAENVFQASLNFNEALTLLCKEQADDVVIILDEFDDVYDRLDVRVLLNLRAFRDRYGAKLKYVAVTTRQLHELKGHENETEFAEMFTNRVFYAGPLNEADTHEIAQTEAGGVRLTEDDLHFVWVQSGGHPGLVAALVQVIRRMRQAQPSYAPEVGAVFDSDANVRGECVKMWNQLRDDEREALVMYVATPGAPIGSLGAHQLRRYGVLREGEIFSPQFARFVAWQANLPSGAPTGVYIDYDSGEVWVDGRQVELLTDLEFKLLGLLDSRRDRLTDKYLIVESVWGDKYIDQVDDARIEKLVSRLRSKLEPDPGNPRFLVTVRGRGYRLVGRGDDAAG